jgi:hypothetical protein
MRRVISRFALRRQKTVGLMLNFSVTGLLYKSGLTFGREPARSGLLILRVRKDALICRRVREIALRRPGAGVAQW